MEYVNYYTSADVSVFIENPSSDAGDSILIDRLRTVAFTESLSSQAIYGVGNSRFGSLSRGNLYVSGYIELNFTHHLYLKNALTAISTKVNPLTSQSVREIVFNSSIADVNSNVTEKKVLNAEQPRNLNASGIDTFPEGFNFRIVFNNTNFNNTDNAKYFLIEYVKIIGSQLTASVSMDGSVGIVYQFIARQIS